MEQFWIGQLITLFALICGFVTVVNKIGATYAKYLSVLNMDNLLKSHELNSQLTKENTALIIKKADELVNGAFKSTNDLSQGILKICHDELELEVSKRVELITFIDSLNKSMNVPDEKIKIRFPLNYDDFKLIP